MIRRALRTVTCVAAQSQDDADRFVQLGAAPEQVQALGNLKFDITTPDVQGFVEQFHARVPARRPVWIAASTHDGEEQAVIDLHRRLRQQHPDLLLLWAPRHRALPEGGGTGTGTGLERGNPAREAVAGG